MPLKLRFTGEWPPPDLWAQFPNWEYAFDEEGEPDQDETTLRPSDERQFVIEFGFTAADLEQANGRCVPALLAVNGDPDGLTAFTSDTGGWSVQRLGTPARWVCIVEDWLPKAERAPSVSFEDASVFPLLVRSRLPSRESGKPLQFAIRSDGTVGGAG